MIKYLPHQKIDREKWDECVKNSPNGRTYGLSWFLDIVSKDWNALVEDDYVSVFPLTWRKKFGINYLYQPFFTQQLGIFSRYLPDVEKVEEFLSKIPGKFRLAEIQLNEHNPVRKNSTGIKMRRNYELDISASYEKIQEGYNQNTRRNIKKSAENGLEFRKDILPDQLVDLFRENFGAQEGKLSGADYDTARKLMMTAIMKNQGEIAGVFSEGKLCGGVFLLEEPGRITYHLAASTAGGKEKGAMFFLMNCILKEKAGRSAFFDFEGSDNDNVARFYAGFGAKESFYPMVMINRLPYVVLQVLKMSRNVRGH